MSRENRRLEVNDIIASNMTIESIKTLDKSRNTIITAIAYDNSTLLPSSTLVHPTRKEKAYTQIESSIIGDSEDMLPLRAPYSPEVQDFATETRLRETCQQK